MISGLIAAILLINVPHELTAEVSSVYSIKVVLDTSSHTLNGTERIIFINPTSTTLDKICFHLYPNAFKDTSSIFCRENSGVRSRVLAGDTAILSVEKIAIYGIPVDSTRITNQGTLLHISLVSPLPPGKELAIQLDFTLKTPRTIERFGYDHRGNYLLTQWFPILAGYQNDRLIDSEYHANTEFFSNFSNYEVLITTPVNFELGATGEVSLLRKDSLVAEWRVSADTVIDFAFACGPKFKKFESDTLGIKFRYLLTVERADYFEKIDETTKKTIAYNSEKLFKYPYKTFTLVDFNSGAGGMEMPGMVQVTFPEGKANVSDSSELTMGIVHEVTHEWFYASIATNQFDDPWLDEGITTYMTRRIINYYNIPFKFIGPLGYQISGSAGERAIGLFMKADYPIYLKSWDYPDMISYNATIYERASLVMETIEGVMGREDFDKALKNYANLYRFRHPNSIDLEKALSSQTSIDLSKIYSQFIDGTARVDYEIRSVNYEPSTASSADSNYKYDVKVEASRVLDGQLPQIISLILDDGTKVDTTWDGLSKVKVFEFKTKSRPNYAVIDLHNKYSIDENRINNSLYINARGARQASFEWDIIFVVEFLLSWLL